MAKKKATRPKKKQPRPSPQCKAILLCDTTIIEAGTNKVSIIGVFNKFMLSDVPGLTRPCQVFLQLISGIGSYGVTIEVHDLREDKVLARAEIASIQFPDRMAGANVVIPVPAIPLSHTGAYDFVVMADGQEIDRQHFLAVKAEEREDGSDPDEEKSGQ